MRRFEWSRIGQNLVDYTLLLALGGMLAVVSLTRLGAETERMYGVVAYEITTAAYAVINDPEAGSEGGNDGVF